MTCTLFAVSVYTERKKSNLPVLMQENLEALTSGENSGYFRVKERNSNKCTIYVGTRGKIKLFSGTLLYADANGNITFDGQVVCSGDGDVYCKPVECIDLYQILN